MKKATNIVAVLMAILLTLTLFIPTISWIAPYVIGAGFTCGLLIYAVCAIRDRL
jgi:hypothetical protein